LPPPPGASTTNAALEHALVAHHDAALVELVHRVLRDAGDLVRVVEVRVEHHVLVELPRLLDDARERIRPRVIGEDLLRHDRGTLGCEAHASHVGHREERVADLFDLLRAQLVAVSTRDDDVLELGA
jgi:hypothetical protein